jgi:hypothetical protein
LKFQLYDVNPVVKETGHNHNKHSGQIRLLHALAEDSMEQVLNFRSPTHSLPEEGNKALKHTLAKRKMFIHIQACQTMMLRIVAMKRKGAYLSAPEKTTT